MFVTRRELSTVHFNSYPIQFDKPYKVRKFASIITVQYGCHIFYMWKHCGVVIICPFVCLSVFLFAKLLNWFWWNLVLGRLL